MASYVIRGLGVIAAVGVFGLSGAPPAEASVTIGDCTITALTPTPVALRDDGTKVADPRASFRCATERPLQFELVLYGDDPVFDDVIHRKPAYWVRVGSAIKTLGEVNNFSLSCNEDVGADELYSKARARIDIGTPAHPVISTWSAWDKGPTVTYSC
jgi:hypothetical protein